MTDKAADESNVYARLDTILMSEPERRQPKASVRNAELIVDLVLRATADMRAVAQGVEHAAAALASGIKMMLAKPVKHWPRAAR
jgi:hypothetical protein